MLSITPVIPNLKLLFGNLLLLEEVGNLLPQRPFPSLFSQWVARGGLSQVPVLVALYLHAQSVRSEPLEQEHRQCWLRNAHAVGESRARHHTGPCQGSDHAISDSVHLGQEQTSALSLPNPCEISSGSRVLPWSDPGWSLALYWTIQTDGRWLGPASAAGLGLCGLCWCWVPSWDAPLSQAVFSVLQIGKSCLRSLKQSKMHYGFPFLLLSQSDSPH